MSAKGASSSSAMFGLAGLVMAFCCFAAPAALGAAVGAAVGKALGVAAAIVVLLAAVLLVRRSDSRPEAASSD